MIAVTREFQARTASLKLQNNLDTVTMSENTHPLLISYLKQLRQRKNIHSRMDIIHKNAQMVSEFNYLCKHNYIFFLTANQRFSELFQYLKSLHKGNPRRASRYRIIKEIEKEHIKALHAQMEVENQKRLQLLKNKIQVPTNSNFYFSFKSLELCQFYEKELQRISTAHYHLQSTIYSTSASKSLQMLERLIGSIDHMDFADEHQKLIFKQEFDSIKEYVNLKQKQWERAALDDTLDASKKCEYAEEFFNATKKITELFLNYSHLSPDIQKLAIEQQKLQNKTMVELEKNEKAFQKEQQFLTKAIDYHKGIVIDNAAQVVGNIIEELKKFDVTDIPKIDELTQKLEIHLHNLHMELDSQSITEIIKMCSADIEILLQHPDTKNNIQLVEMLQINKVHLHELSNEPSHARINDNSVNRNQEPLIDSTNNFRSRIKADRYSIDLEIDPVQVQNDLISSLPDLIKDFESNLDEYTDKIPNIESVINVLKHGVDNNTEHSNLIEIANKLIQETSIKTTSSTNFCNKYENILNLVNQSKNDFSM